MQSQPPLDIYRLSEQAVTIEFGSKIDESILQQVTHFNRLINQNPFPGFQTTVPAYTTLTVFYNPLAVFSSPLPGTSCFEKVSGYLTSLKSKPVSAASVKNETITIPVCYGGVFGPDIADVGKMHHITTDEVIRLHSDAVYKVYMIGFVPGFAYLGGMTDLLTSPRKQVPREVIPAGSVGIAGNQTGVYPLATPGGWQLIGRTPLKLFDVRRSRPSLLKAGDNVVFKPIDSREFDHLANLKNADTDH